MEKNERISLQVGTEIELFHIKTGNATTYRITEIVGCGTSCIVYSAEEVSSNGIRVRLKEYYPVGDFVERSDNNNLIVKNAFEFEKGMNRFIDSYELQIKLRNLDSMTNSVSNIHGVYRAHNTLYTVMTYNVGCSYDQKEDDSLNSLFKVTRSIAKAIYEYHKIGLLHLDIKPSNVYVLPETDESVILFDFDSVVSKSDIRSGKIRCYSYTKEWAAPEQLQYKTSKISEQTDIYAIGAIVFRRIFNRSVNFADRMKNATYEYDYNNKLLENINPEVFVLVTEFFNKTLTSNPADRYDSVLYVIEILEKLIKLSDKDRVYIVSNSIITNNHFVGRDFEIKLIEELLQKEHTVFINGFAGVGKSEIAKQFAKNYRNQYDTVVFANYSDDLLELITNDESLKLANFFKQPEETQQTYAKRKIKEIKKLCNNRMLLIIDNFDVEDDPMLLDIISFNCKKIFTSRVDFSERFAQISLTPVSFGLIKKMYSMVGVFINEGDEETALRNIYNYFDGNTLVMEFIAKQIRENYNSIEDVLTLVEQGKSEKNSDHSKIVDFFYAQLRLNKLNKREIYALQVLSAAHLMGVQADTLKVSCDFSNYQELNSLERKGFIQYHQQTHRFTMHSVLKEMINTYINDDSAEDTVLKCTLQDVSATLSCIDQKNLAIALNDSFFSSAKGENKCFLCFNDNDFVSKVEKAKKHLGYSDVDEYPIWLFDLSILNNMREGILLTNKRIYVKTMYYHKYCITYDSIKRLYKSGIQVNVLLENGEHRVLVASNQNSEYIYNLLISFFNNIANNCANNHTKYQKSTANNEDNVYIIKHFVTSQKLKEDKINRVNEFVRIQLSDKIRSYGLSSSDKKIKIYTSDVVGFSEKICGFFELNFDEIPFLLAEYGDLGFVLTDRRIVFHQNKGYYVQYNDISCIRKKRMPILKYYYLDLVKKNDANLHILVSTYSKKEIDNLFDIITSFFEYVDKILSE